LITSSSYSDCCHGDELSIIIKSGCLSDDFGSSGEVDLGEREASVGGASSVTKISFDLFDIFGCDVSQCCGESEWCIGWDGE
jgi:hypothetical protein